MPTICHFNIPVDDIERARAFYSDLFGWKIEKLPGPMEYYNIDTSTMDQEGVGGGMAMRDDPQEGIVNYIDVSSVDDHCAKVTQLGGKVVVPKMPIPGFGFLAVCLDTENNVFGLWETAEKT